MKLFFSKNTRLGLISVLLCHLLATPALSEMLGTDRIITHHQNRQTIDTALLREDVKQHLLSHGVAPHDVQLRLDQLTPQELQTLADEFNQLPAAGSPTALMLLPGPIILMLELTGMTDMSTSF